MHMEFPEDKETMHSFLGLVNFLNRYSSELTQLCEPLRKLILKDQHYTVTELHRHAFLAIKKEFRKHIVLPYFNKDETTTLQTDASKKGFGAVLLQAGKPVYFASRSLTTTEQNYQNLEREAMAAIWGMEKFHYFLYGRRFILQTDQKPLEAIFRKHLVDVSPRIQRIAIRSWPYDFETQWIKGKLNVVADALSRVSPTESDDSEAITIKAVNILATSNIQQHDKEQLQNATKEDEELQALLKTDLRWMATAEEESKKISSTILEFPR